MNNNEILRQIKSGEIRGREAFSAFAKKHRQDGSIDQPVFENTTALNWACKNKNVDLLAAFLAAGALPNGSAAPGNNRIFPLASAMAGMPGAEGAECAELLLNAGARLDDLDPSGLGPLHCAAMFNPSGEGVRWLLAKGANPLSAGKDGLTALHVAAGIKNINAAKALIDAGADPRALANCEFLSVHQNEGEKLASPLDLAKAVELDAGEMVDLLRQAGQALTDREVLEEATRVPASTRMMRARGGL